MDLEFDNGQPLKAGTLYCLAKNYHSHAAEMRNTVPDEPSVFLKPPSAIVKSGGEIEYPPFSKIVHHEVELVVVIGRACRRVRRRDAAACIAGYAVGLDITARDVQHKAIKEGNPWGVCKGFYSSAPVSQVVDAQRFGGEMPFFDIELYVNGQLRQKDNTKNLVRPVDELIEYLSDVFLLEKGDCIFTGTPAGVGKIERGDLLCGRLGDFVECSVAVGG